MASYCDKAQLFVDGELPPEEAEAFRLHLPDCVKCQQEVANLMQLDFLAEGYVQERAEREEAQARRLVPPRRWRFPALGAMAALAAALSVLVVRMPFSDAPQHDVWLAERDYRLLEARVSYRIADKHRDRPVKMGSGGDGEELSLEDLAVLEKHDPHGLIAAYLVQADRDLAERALRTLKKMERSPDLDSDRAVALLLRGEHEQALRLLDAVLAQHPQHPQALWNRGLVLRDLNLPLLAARDFSRVHELNEEGWSQEAERRAAALRSAESKRRNQWEQASQAADRLIHESLDLPKNFSQLPDARRLFYEVVRTAPSRERVLALLPTARELDAQAGGNVLEGHVLRVAKEDFKRRAPLAGAYAALLRGRLSREERERFLVELLGSGEDDILLGALVAMEATSRYPDVYQEKAAASGDPWFQLVAAQLRAKAEAAAGQSMKAIGTIRDARRLCGGGLEYRCITLELELSSLYTNLHKLERARKHAEQGWEEARKRNEWLLEPSLLWNLSQIARLSGDTSLARAYLGEYREHNGNTPDAVRRVHQELAVMAMQELRRDEARREIDAAIATGRPLGLPGVFAVADISRKRRAPNDEAYLTRAVEELKPNLSPGERVIATHVLGRFFIDSEVEKEKERGRDLLLRVIQEAEAPELTGDKGARRARAYSFTSLLMAAGQRGAFQEALELFERERRLELPKRCLLAATADSERTLLVARGDEGGLVGHYENEREEPLPRRLDGLVPEALLAPLRKCEQVEVLARPPLHGRAGLLPLELAWSYLTRTSPPRAARPGPAVHLVVSNVELPPDAPLERLNDWEASFGPEEQPERLSGAAATPTRVLAAMKDATEIDLVAHGILSDASDASYLLLAPEQPEGPELSESEVRAASLQGAPFVVLAACHAAHATYSVDEPLSLPAAFIAAGARGVLAATVEIPDLEAEAFFNAVREHMRSGLSPAVALHQERLRWMREGRGAEWLDKVLLFE
ncbi:MAG: CHAT domain-containing protein [Myxococcaceae bacterium]|nr:CHAT domain-containing protein [Myxococcaceae bacterium]